MTALADPIKTPGTLASGVTLAIISHPGYSKSVRPSKWVSSRMKLATMKAYGIPRRKIFSYTGDHLIAIENGGNPGSVTDLTNYWPQPKKEASLKDQQENLLHKRLMNRSLTIEAAAEQVRAIWVERI